MLGTKHSYEVNKITNEIVKAIVLGYHKEMIIGQLLSHLSLKVVNIVTNYILKHA